MIDDIDIGTFSEKQRARREAICNDLHDPMLTIEYIANMYGVTKQRISQISKQFLNLRPQDRRKERARLKATKLVFKTTPEVDLVIKEAGKNGLTATPKVMPCSARSDLSSPNWIVVNGKDVKFRTCGKPFFLKAGQRMYAHFNAYPPIDLPAIYLVNIEGYPREFYIFPQDLRRVTYIPINESKRPLMKAKTDYSQYKNNWDILR